MKYIYNYQTGRSAPLGEEPIDMDANAICVSYNNPKSLVHSSKSPVHCLILVQSDVDV
jgi:hypothetical protein